MQSSQRATCGVFARINARINPFERYKACSLSLKVTDKEAKLVWILGPRDGWSSDDAFDGAYLPTGGDARRRKSNNFRCLPGCFGPRGHEKLKLRGSWFALTWGF